MRGHAGRHRLKMLEEKKLQRLLSFHWSQQQLVVSVAANVLRGATNKDPH